MQKNTQSGFSLVELMVVVAIIGILATVAIPKVNRFIAKARQAEATVTLSSIYTFNKNFFVEYSGYTSDLRAMGFSPEGQMRYNAGFSQAGTGPSNYTTLKPGAAYGGPSNTLALCTAAGNTVCKIVNGADNSPPPAVSGSTCAAPFDTFKAAAVAKLMRGTGIPNDIWTIDNNKVLETTSDGLGN